MVEPVLDRPGLEDRHDVWVVQGRGGPGLALEPPAELVVAGQGWSDDLQRDLATEVHLLGEIDHAHTAAAQLHLDVEAVELLARQRLLIVRHN